MIYFFQQGGPQGPIKIGYTADDCPEARRSQIQTGSASSIEVVGWVDGTQQYERALHAKFDSKRKKGEWFEWDHELQDYIDEVCQDGLPDNPVDLIALCYRRKLRVEVDGEGVKVISTQGAPVPRHIERKLQSISDKVIRFFETSER